MTAETVIILAGTILAGTAAVYYGTVIIQLITAGILDAVDRRRKNRHHAK